MLREQKLITVSSLSPPRTEGTVFMGQLRLACALGRGGRRHVKWEGDGATPIGRWPLRQVFYRADRVRRPRTGLPVAPLRPDFGWCDDPASQLYNRLVHLPFSARHERLWRDDHLYDIIVVVGYNDAPRTLRKGSAIFMHLAQPGYKPTEGCIALKEPHLRRLLMLAGPQTAVQVRD